MSEKAVLPFIDSARLAAKSRGHLAQRFHHSPARGSVHLPIVLTMNAFSVASIDSATRFARRKQPHARDNHTSTLQCANPAERRRP